MAPKKGRRVVRTTTKVVQETVEVVSVLGSQEDSVQALAQAQPEVSEQREEQTSVVTKSIPIEGEEEEEEEAQDEETEAQEPDTPLEELKFYNIATPPREEAPPRQEEDVARDQARPGKRVKSEAQKKEKEKVAVTKTGRKGGKRRRMRGGMGEGGEGYKRYVFKVMKQVHPGMAITSGAMTVINNFMTDMFERLAGEASKLSTYSKKQTMTAREIQGAVKLVLPGELGKHAVAEGSKAVSNYVTYLSKK